NIARDTAHVAAPAPKRDVQRVCRSIHHGSGLSALANSPGARLRTEAPQRTPPYSITSSVRASKAGRTTTPSGLPLECLLAHDAQCQVPEATEVSGPGVSAVPVDLGHDVTAV